MAVPLFGGCPIWCSRDHFVRNGAWPEERHVRRFSSQDDLRGSATFTLLVTQIVGDSTRVEAELWSGGQAVHTLALDSVAELARSLIEAGKALMLAADELAGSGDPGRGPGATHGVAPAAVRDADSASAPAWFNSAARSGLGPIRRSASPSAPGK